MAGRPDGVRLGAALLALALAGGGCHAGDRFRAEEAGAPASPGVSAAGTRGGKSGGPVDAESGLRWIEVTALPREGRRTLDLIDKGGPFPYPKDGTTFRNAERVLPKHPSGYYREYTVPTPGSGDRGARRIVCGQRKDCYYTHDHYSTFERIRR